MDCTICAIAGPFGAPLWLLGVLAVAEVVTLVVWLARRTRTAGLAAAVPALLAGLVLLVAWLVVTDRERIERGYQAIAADLVAGRTGALQVYLDEDCRVGLDPEARVLALDKADVIRLAERYVAEMKLREIKLSRMTVDVGAGRGESEVTTMIHSDWPDVAGATFAIRWRVTWVEREDGWRVLRAQTTGPKDLFEGD